MGVSKPVAFLIFNRPQLTQRVFEAIAQAKPKQLLVVADGPRFPEEAEKCQQTQSVIEQVDWDCEVLTNFADHNLGCKQRIASGLDWVFSQVEEAIILEDDCLPDPSFFEFCQTLLDYYRHDQRIMHISGDNFQLGQSRTPYSYYFSRYPHIWGWATWRRAWQHYDVTMADWTAFRDSGRLQAVFETEEEQEYWKNLLDRAFCGEFNTWDFAWAYACWSQNGLSILPNVNLVSNIGFGEEATFKKLQHPLANLPRQSLSGLKHPPFIVPNREADRFTCQYVFLEEAKFYSQQIAIEDKQREVEQSHQELRHLQQQLIVTKEQMETMKSSKFWKIRQKWLKLKQKLKLTQENEPSLPQDLDQLLSTPNPVSESNDVEMTSDPVVEPMQTLQTAPPVQAEAPSPIDEHLNYIQTTVQPFTLVGPERIESLYNLSKRIDQENIPGDVIECGVCNGGTAAILAHFASKSPKYQRTTWLFDSFEGMPEITEEDDQAAQEYVGKVVGDISQVLTVLNLVNADLTKVKIVKGWFDDTFPTVTIPQIALLNIDADWYLPVKLCLETFYDAVVPGGFISFDDYGHWSGCKKAVDEFFEKRQLTYELHQVDYTAHWIQKL